MSAPKHTVIFCLIALLCNVDFISDLLCGSGMHILSVGPSSSSVTVSSDPLEQLMDEMAGVE